MYSLMICSKKSSHCETTGVASPAGVFVAGSRCIVLLCQDTGEIVSTVFIAAYLCIKLVIFNLLPVRSYVFVRPVF
jgi:hypothetical protein